MSHESIVFTGLCLILGGIFTLTHLVQKQRVCLRRLDIKLDALLKAQGVEWSSLSPEVQALAESGRKIAAIKLHRDENPDMDLAEAKTEVEAFAAQKH